MFRFLLLLFWICPVLAFASSLSPLLDRLVEKDVLTASESQEIQREMFMKRKGMDDRFRFHGTLISQFRHHNRSIPNDAGRDIGALLTAKAGVDVQVSPDTIVKLGLSTGDGNSRYRYQRASNFQSYPLQLDYAFGEIEYMPNFFIKAGKMTTPYWLVSDMIWDWDITHDGILFDVVINPKHDLRFGYFFLDQYEQHGEFGPRLISGQYLYNTVSESGGLFKLGFSGYFFGFVEGRQLSDGKTVSGLNNTTHTKTVDGESAAAVSEHFSVFQTALSYDIQPEKWKWLRGRHVVMFADFVYNLGVSKSNRGALVGITLGDLLVTDFGQWRGTVDYRYIQSNAFLDVFPNNEAYGGNTGIKGIHFGYEIGMRPGLSFLADGYFMEAASVSTIDTVVTAAFKATF